MTESKTPRTLGLYTNWLFEKAGTPYFAAYRDDLRAIAYVIERLEADLTDALTAKELAEAERDALGPLTDDLIAILGRPNFQCAGIAELLRIRGDDIKHKSESEQAAAIHFLLGFYLKHGPEWAIVAGAELKRLSEIRDEAIADAARGVKT